MRSILRNEKYVGIYVFNNRQWIKKPGTNKRQKRNRPVGEHIRVELEELRIIDEDLWHRVQVRIDDVRRTYTRTVDGQAKGRAIPGNSTPRPLSGLVLPQNPIGH